MTNAVRAASPNYRDRDVAAGGCLRNDTQPVVPLSNGADKVIDIGDAADRDFRSRSGITTNSGAFLGSSHSDNMPLLRARGKPTSRISVATLIA
ncbi:MAG: hypothetical protein AAF664_26230 [Planctomycetota bacterium]